MCAIRLSILESSVLMQRVVVRGAGLWPCPQNACILEGWFRRDQVILSLRPPA